VRNVGFSDAINLKRSGQQPWTSTRLDVDLVRALTLAFVRLAENAPDLEFAEPLIWRAAQTRVRVEFWANEPCTTTGSATSRPARAAATDGRI